MCLSFVLRLVIRGGFAVDLSGLVYARIGLVPLLTFAFWALNRHNQEGARACSSSYLDVSGMAARKITAVDYCYSAFHDRIHSASDPARFNGFYDAMPWFFFLNAIIGVILVESIMAFSGMPRAIFQCFPTLSCKAMAECLDEWIGIPKLNQVTAESSQSSSFQCVDETAFQSAEAPQVSSSASAQASRGWANRRTFWTANHNQRWRFIACFVLARVCSVVIGPLVLLCADLFFFRGFVLLNREIFADDHLGFCRYTLFDALDPERPVRLSLLCSLNTNATYRWLTPVSYGLVIFLSAVMFCANLHWIIQFRRRREFLQSAVMYGLRREDLAIDEDDVREFAAAVPTALWLCLQLLGSRTLHASEISELAYLLYK